MTYRTKEQIFVPVRDREFVTYKVASRGTKVTHTHTYTHTSLSRTKYMYSNLTPRIVIQFVTLMFMSLPIYMKTGVPQEALHSSLHLHISSFNVNITPFVLIVSTFLSFLFPFNG